jgi:hypothetical protein
MYGRVRLLLRKRWLLTTKDTIRLADERVKRWTDLKNLFGESLIIDRYVVRPLCPSSSKRSTQLLNLGINGVGIYHHGPTHREII